jgi:hypothetical protein
MTRDGGSIRLAGQSQALRLTKMAMRYSKAVLKALRSHGLAEHTILALTGLDAAGLAAISQGRREFTFRQIRRLEEETGKTSGQLAASTVEPNGGSLTEICNDLARFNTAVARHRKTPSAGAFHAISRPIGKNGPQVVGGDETVRPCMAARGASKRHRRGKVVPKRDDKVKALRTV